MQYIQSSAIYLFSFISHCPLHSRNTKLCFPEHFAPWNFNAFADVVPSAQSFLVPFIFRKKSFYSLFTERGSSSGTSDILISSKGQLRLDVSNCLFFLFTSPFTFFLSLERPVREAWLHNSPTQVLPSGASWRPGEGHWHRICPLITSQPY